MAARMPHTVRTKVRTPTIHKKIVVKGGLLLSTLKLFTSPFSLQDILSLRTNRILEET